MDIKLKSEIYDMDIRSHPDFDSESDYFAGYFADDEEVTNNQSFLKLYRQVQYFRLRIPMELYNYACIPNYAPISLIENMRLTGEDTYFYELKAMIENRLNMYFPRRELEEETNDELSFVYIAENDRADLAQYYYDNGAIPCDIYCNFNSANSTFEVVKVMLKNDYIPSDNVIYWYLTNGMGAIAKCAFTDFNDMSDLVNCNPIDLDSYLLIKNHREFTFDETMENLMHLITRPELVDCALFLELYSKVSDILTETEKLSLLQKIISKNDKFLIYIYMKKLSEEGFSNNVLENQVFRLNIGQSGYIIFKLQIEELTDYDLIIAMSSELSIREMFNFDVFDESSSSDASYSNDSDYSEDDGYETDDTY